jgi:hypothetical protein
VVLACGIYWHPAFAGNDRKCHTLSSGFLGWRRLMAAFLGGLDVFMLWWAALWAGVA